MDLTAFHPELRSVARWLPRGAGRPWLVKLSRLDSASNRYGWTSYLGREPGSPDVSDHAAPGRRADFSGLPPTWLGVGTCDLFHDEDVAYASKLREAGVPTTLEVVEGAFHAFDMIARKASVSERFFASQVAAIQRVTGAGAPPEPPRRSRDHR